MSFNEKIEAYGSAAENLKVYYWFLYPCAIASAFWVFSLWGCTGEVDIIMLVANCLTLPLSVISIFTLRKLNENSYAFGISLGIVLATYPIVIAGYLAIFISPRVVFHDANTAFRIYPLTILGAVIIHMFQSKKLLFFGTAAEVIAHGNKEKSYLQGITNRQTIINTESTSADELLKYKKLLDDGAITQEEYDTKKRKLLSDKPERQAAPSVSDDSMPALEPVKPHRFGFLKSFLSLFVLFLCVFGLKYFNAHDAKREVPTYDRNAYSADQKRIVDALQTNIGYTPYGDLPAQGKGIAGVYFNDSRESYDVVMQLTDVTKDAITLAKEQGGNSLLLMEAAFKKVQNELCAFNLECDAFIASRGSSYDTYIYLSDANNAKEYLILVHDGKVVDSII